MTVIQFFREKTAKNRFLKIQKINSHGVGGQFRYGTATDITKTERKYLFCRKK